MTEPHGCFGIFKFSVTADDYGNIIMGYFIQILQKSQAVHNRHTDVYENDVCRILQKSI